MNEGKRGKLARLLDLKKEINFFFHQYGETLGKIKAQKSPRLDDVLHFSEKINLTLNAPKGYVQGMPAVPPNGRLRFHFPSPQPHEMKNGHLQKLQLSFLQEQESTKNVYTTTQHDYDEPGIKSTKRPLDDYEYPSPKRNPSPSKFESSENSNQMYVSPKEFPVDMDVQSNPTNIAVDEIVSRATINEPIMSAKLTIPPSVSAPIAARPNVNMSMFGFNDAESDESDKDDD